jgi:hypothetical protein
VNSQSIPNCPFCKIPLNEPETIYYDDGLFFVCDTLDKKMHRARIMVVYIPHEKEIPEELEELALKILEAVGREVFSYTDKFVIMDSTYARFPDHWHRVASDLDLDAEDYQQILKTKIIKEISIRGG